MSRNGIIPWYILFSLWSYLYISPKHSTNNALLTHWGRVTHIRVRKLAAIWSRLQCDWPAINCIWQIVNEADLGMGGCGVVYKFFWYISRWNDLWYTCWKSRYKYNEPPYDCNRNISIELYILSVQACQQVLRTLLNSKQGSNFRISNVHDDTTVFALRGNITVTS